MIEYLNNNLSKKLTREILILGLMIFIPVYAYIYRMFSTMGIDTSDFNLVWLSFDGPSFEAFFLKVELLGQLETFIWTFNLNILSMTGFMLTFFSLTLMLARQQSETSRLYRFAYIFPFIAVAVALLDIIPSLVFLMATSEIPQLSQTVIYTISGCYVVRVILLYLVLLWMIYAAVTILQRKFRDAKA